MKKLMEQMAEELSAAFEKSGYDPSYGKVTVSNRPDLCEFQCNGAMAGAKAYKKAPFMIADDVVAYLKDSQVFSMAEVVKPGFINLKVKGEFLADYLKEMAADEKLSVSAAKEPKTIIIDYGGPNVAKPLHVGHLRSAIIGESIKRIGRFVGHKVIGDVHLGDWGLQMGLIITELKHRKPELVYFDDSYTGEYPEEAPFTISELEEIYPCASGKSKEDEAYRNEALEATHLLQQGKPGYMALWNHIMNVSVTDLKRNYDKLNVSFDLWKKESDAQPYIPGMVEEMKEKGFAYVDQGALVVDVKEENDTKEIPPCMLLKSDGASLYNTTDLATMVWRMKDYNPDELIAYIGKRKVVVESSNTKVATVKIKDNAIWATPQKAGTTTITVKTERETYKCTFTVYKYVNPVSSAKVGKLTIKGTAFKKNAIYNLRYSKYKNKSIAFKFNLKKGWKLRGGISYARSNWGVAKMLPNGSKIKVAGGSGFLAVALAENIKTGQRERIHIYFK